MLAITICVVAILLCAYVLIMTESMHHINKAAVAIFAAAVCWILYICEGPSFVMREHATQYLQFLDGRSSSIILVNKYITQNLFSGCVSSACEIILFTLSTFTIVDVLSNNDCFDFITKLLRTRSTKKLLWSITAITFFLSATLDNMVTVALMLTILHTLVEDRKTKMFMGAAILIAANCGGAFTVIGDVTSLVLWVKGAVTPTDYAIHMFVPSLIGWVVPTFLISRSLPHRLDNIAAMNYYRGESTRLKVWERVLMLFVGIGGLWFIPSFHRLTQLPSFVGALCVLALLWIVHEVVNRKFTRSGQMFLQKMPRALQYSHMQTIFFILGMFLAVGALQETGVMQQYGKWCTENLHNIYIYSITVGLLSSLMDNFVLVLASITTFPIVDISSIMSHPDVQYLSYFATDGAYWTLLSFSTTLGGTLLTFSSLAGYAYMRMENVSVKWYISNITGKVLIGWLLGLGAYFLMYTFILENFSI